MSIGRAPIAPVSLSAVALTTFTSAPWYAYVIVMSAGLVAYLVNRALISWIAWKALDKVEPGQVTDLMTTITGLPKPPFNPWTAARRWSPDRNNVPSAEHNHKRSEHDIRYE
jgi:hypothetical protein